MKQHKFNIFPEMLAEDRARVKADIEQHGYKTDMPIILYQGAILDGWNRYLICQELGTKPTYREFSGTDTDAIAYTMRTNKRRNLTSSQWAAIAVEAEDVVKAIAADAHNRKLATLKQNTDPQLIAERSRATGSQEENETRHKVARLFHTNRQYISDAQRLKDEDPEAFEAVKTGVKTITEVKRETREAKKEQRREENREKIKLAEKPAEILSTGGKFATILIDPPWDWGDEDDCDQLGRARPDYATMSIREIAALPVGALADVDCHLYLWITNRSLPKGFDLIEKWGFRYITALTWVKPSFGMGNYFRGQTEHVLFAIKGSQPLNNKSTSTVFYADRGSGGHSSKPDDIYRIVESCSPGPYLEMFGRTERENWRRWGE